MFFSFHRTLKSVGGAARLGTGAAKAIDPEPRGRQKTSQAAKRNLGCQVRAWSPHDRQAIQYNATTGSKTVRQNAAHEPECSLVC